MLKNYLNIALRNLLRHKSYAVISVLSLVVGITCFLFLMLYVKYELNYDSFHKNEKRIYQVGLNFTEGDFFGYKYTSLMPGVLSPTLKREFPDVEYSVRVKKNRSKVFYGNNGFIVNGLHADADFFNIFTFPAIKGSTEKALKDPKTIVLTESLAGKLFGNEDPVGKVVNCGDKSEFTVTAVVKDSPDNSNLKFDYIISFVTLSSTAQYIDSRWGNLDWPTYIMLKENVPVKEFEKKLTNIVNKYNSNSQLDLLKKAEYFLLPISELHFSTNMLTDSEQDVNKKFIYLLALIAAFVLIIGCINYMNLATARAGTRSKEVGIRKTVGANRLQLMKQFLSESFVVAFLSIVLSLVFVWVVFPYFKEIAGNGIQLSILSDWTTIAGLVGLFIAVAFISGSYPAFMLSSMKPVNVLKSSKQTNLAGKHLKFRNLLVVFQFCITIVLVVAAIVVHSQLNFAKNSDIGYKRDNIVKVGLGDLESIKNGQLIKTELLQNPNIQSVSLASTAPITLYNIGPTKIENETGLMNEVDGMVSQYSVDQDYINLFNMKILSGRGFSLEFSGNIENQVIINETTARLAGIKNPIGRKLERNGTEYQIIGVVKDFHYTSMKQKIEPLILTYTPNRFFVVFAKISDKNIGTTLAAMNSIFKKFGKNVVFNYSFMDELYNNLYKKENDLGGITLSFSIITIAIASIGLFGLISFIVGRKTKEIGVRKILGASVVQVIWYITKEFFILFIIALVVSIPAAYYFTSGWLQDFAYRINLSVWLFALAIAIIAMIAFMSVAQQVIKAAIANPVDSLRSE